MTGLPPTAPTSTRCGIDWFSGTLLRDSQRSAQFVRSAQEAIIKIAEGGYKLEERSLLGYTGHSAGNCFIGENADRYFVQLTGYHANDHFAAIYRRDMHVSRVDVQTSATYAVMPLNVAKKGYKDAMSANSTLPTHRRRKIHIIIGSDGGDTLYIGSASSDQRGRLYNKEVQSQDPSYERTWRYEVVFKNDFAGSVCNSLPFDLHERTSRISALCGLWFESRGVEASFADTDPNASLPLVKTLPTDVEKKLAWIAGQVAPTIRYLCASGYGATLQSLLPELFVPPEQ